MVRSRERGSSVRSRLLFRRCGDCSSEVRVPGCGPGSRGFKSHQSPFFPILRAGARSRQRSLLDWKGRWRGKLWGTFLPGEASYDQCTGSREFEVPLRKTRRPKRNRVAQPDTLAPRWSCTRGAFCCPRHKKTPLRSGARTKKGKNLFWRRFRPAVVPAWARQGSTELKNSRTPIRAIPRPAPNSILLARTAARAEPRYARP